jgi:hypothetical protein
VPMVVGRCLCRMIVQYLICHLQADEAMRIKHEVETFGSRVQAFRAALHSRAFYMYSTGATAAYALIDEAAAELARLRGECKHYSVLATTFELVGLVPPIEEAIRGAQDDLVAIKDVWDVQMLVEIQLQVCVLVKQPRYAAGKSQTWKLFTLCPALGDALPRATGGGDAV